MAFKVRGPFGQYPPTTNSISCSSSVVRNSRTTPDGGAAGTSARSVRQRPVEFSGRRTARFPEITTCSGFPGAPGRGAKDADLAVTVFHDHKRRLRKVNRSI